ncbi:MAG: carboxynorspermidine decarboxylase [Eubacteriales bacterium]|nr:carboxynorspermidine decarboxylase [Eubacteriales bacterium]
MPIDFHSVPTPCYVVDEKLLERNLKILDSVQQRTGCKILLALKGFSMFATFPLVGRYLQGITASSLHEARLGREEMDKEVHIFAPAYIEEDFDEILSLVDHVVFNSFNQLAKYKDRVKQSGRPIEIGVRVNPEYSEIATDLYNPCAPYSRLGITRANFRPEEMEGVDGIHFHTLCEQNSDALAHTLPVFEEKFGPFLKGLKWINFGGGHHITRPDYDIESLIRSITTIQDKYQVQVYLEPGEAIALNTGYLVTSVLDIIENGKQLAILDTSAACHMPDVLEMPYRPMIIGSGEGGEKPYTYRLGGPTCLAGDVIGDYSFDAPLSPGDRLVFTDMAHYTMVKNNTFNGIGLPSIALSDLSGQLRVIKRFGYDDFKGRLS